MSKCYLAIPMLAIGLVTLMPASFAADLKAKGAESDKTTTTTTTDEHDKCWTQSRDKKGHFGKMVEGPCQKVEDPAKVAPAMPAPRNEDAK